MKTNNYLEKLRDPRWQKKRLEIMQRDDFCCAYCNNANSTLNVHHKYYLNNTDPWDYPIEAFITLCEDCHEVETSQINTYIPSITLTLKREMSSFSIGLFDIILMRIDECGFKLHEVTKYLSCMSDDGIKNVMNYISKVAETDHENLPF